MGLAVTISEQYLHITKANGCGKRATHFTDSGTVLQPENIVYIQIGVAELLALR